MDTFRRLKDILQLTIVGGIKNELPFLNYNVSFSILAIFPHYGFNIGHNNSKLGHKDENFTCKPLIYL